MAKECMSVEEEVVGLLKEYGLTVTTAESCTGGMIASKIVNVSGASDVFCEGYVTYSNAAKHKLLGVKNETLEAYGAVSSQTAGEMAVGAARAAEADASIAATGIAGPGGGTAEKPVGLVYISCFVKGDVAVEECHFKGTRLEVREQSAVTALNLLRKMILKNYR